MSIPPINRLILPSNRLGYVPWWVKGLAFAVSILSLLPLIFIVYISTQIGWHDSTALIFRSRVVEFLLNSILLIALTVPICIVLAIALAWLTERCNLVLRRWWSLLFSAPLAIPAFIQSYAWISLIPSLHGLSAALLFSVISYYPFLYLPLVATFRRLDPALEDAAATLGLPPHIVFRRVILPQLYIAIRDGALMVSVHLLSEYGLFEMIRYDTLTTAIMDRFQYSTSANILAIVLALCCLGLLCSEALLGRKRYARRYAPVGSGSPRIALTLKLSWFYQNLGQLLASIIVILSLGVPLVMISKWLFIGDLNVWYFPELWKALQQTLILSITSAFLTCFAAIPIAWLSIRRPGRLQLFLEACNYIASSLPSIVVSLALVTVTIRVVRPLYQTMFTVLIAYLIMFLSRALVGLRSGIAQARVELEHAAYSLGLSPLKTLYKITLRIAAPSMMAAATLVFFATLSELTATLLLSPNGTQTLATRFWALTSEIDYVAAAPYALIMITISLPLTVWLHYQSRRLAGR
ncbi:MAG: iron ABC transporter permease [Burkholderia sp.]|nr:iron ABC transporter permease [Burkholderia sp.]